MRYPFPGLDEMKHPKTYFEELPKIAETKPGTGFVASFNGVWAYDFDDIAHDFCVNSRKEDMASADALYPTEFKDGDALYFIEFKDRRLAELNEQGADGSDETIDIELSKKASDSLMVLAATLLRDGTMSDVQRRSEFIVVYNDTPPGDEDPESIRKFADDLAAWSKIGKDKQGVTVLWDLNRFKTAGFYRQVHTWSESQFRKFARGFMQRTDGTNDF